LFLNAAGNVTSVHIGKYMDVATLARDIDPARPAGGMVTEGAAGSSPAEGFANRPTVRFSGFRSGLDDHFRGEEKRSPFGAARDIYW
jgi:hypothetical protein